MHTTIWLADRNGNGFELTCHGKNNVRIKPVFNDQITGELKSGTLSAPPFIEVPALAITRALDVLNYAANNGDVGAKL